MRRFLVALIAVGLVTAACGTGTGRARQLRIVNEALDEAQQTSREFEYVERIPKPEREIKIRGSVQDDLRSTATLSIDGQDVLTQTVSDDAIAIRVLNNDLAKPLIEFVTKQDKDAGAALGSGKWIIDHQGAPDLIGPRTSEGTFLAGENPILDSTVYAFQYFDEAIKESAGVVEFNPDAIEYNPLDDPWNEDAKRDLVGDGIRRYDIGQPQLPRPTARGTQQALPGTRHFRKMVFYLKGEEVTRIAEQIKISDRPEFRRAAAGRAAQYYVELMHQAVEGATRDPVRERSMEYEITKGDGPPIELPIDGVVNVPAINLSEGVSALFVVEEQRTSPVPGIPIPQQPAPQSSADTSADAV